MNKEEIKELEILEFRNLNNYEKLEVERLKNKINEIIKTINILNKKQLENIKQPTIFIDTQDMEERYAEGLYMDYLKEENKKYKEVIDKAINDLNIIIDIVRELPLGSDCWIIDRLEANKSILKEVSE